MADQGDKTEQPTPKRLQEAREKGQVPRSRELGTTVVLLFGAVGLHALGASLGQGLEQIMVHGLRLDRGEVMDPRAMAEHLGFALGASGRLVLPFALLALLAAFVPPLLLGGWSFSTRALAPKFSKLNPVKGLARLFSVNGAVELAKSLVKVALIGGVSAALIWSRADDLLALGGGGVRAAVRASFEIVAGAFLLMAASTILIAAVDAPYQLWNNRRQLRMTRQEVRDERKNTEGDPEVRARIRRVQQEMAMQRMMEKVPEADVVVTNPTHFAVALRYDPDGQGAPRVVARGADLIAARIRSLAREHRVPVFQAPPLARALYHSTELDQEIPAGLYVAVAQVLAYVYQLRNAAPGQSPAPPADLPIPEDLRHDP